MSSANRNFTTSQATTYLHGLMFLGGHHSISRGGGGWSFFEINNFGQTLREINNLLQELFYINMLENVKFQELFYINM